MCMCACACACPQDAVGRLEHHLGKRATSQLWGTVCEGHTDVGAVVAASFVYALDRCHLPLGALCLPFTAYYLSATQCSLLAACRCLLSERGGTGTSVDVAHLMSACERARLLFRMRVAADALQPPIISPLALQAMAPVVRHLVMAGPAVPESDGGDDAEAGTEAETVSK